MKIKKSEPTRASCTTVIPFTVSVSQEDSSSDKVECVKQTLKPYYLSKPMLNSVFIYCIKPVKNKLKVIENSKNDAVSLPLNSFSRHILYLHHACIICSTVERLLKPSLPKFTFGSKMISFYF